MRKSHGYITSHCKSSRNYKHKISHKILLWRRNWKSVKYLKCNDFFLVKICLLQGVLMSFFHCTYCWSINFQSMERYLSHQTVGLLIISAWTASTPGWHLRDTHTHKFSRVVATLERAVTNTHYFEWLSNFSIAPSPNSFTAMLRELQSVKSVTFFTLPKRFWEIGWQKYYSRHKSY
jgi:hypothetical protein